MDTIALLHGYGAGAYGAYLPRGRVLGQSVPGELRGGGGAPAAAPGRDAAIAVVVFLGSIALFGAVGVVLARATAR